MEIPEKIMRLLGNGQSRPTSTESKQEKIARVNAVAGDLVGVDCKKCLNRGYITKLDESGREYVQECSCKIQRRALKRLAATGLTETMLQKHLDNFKTIDAWQKNALDLAKRYAYQQMDWRWFVAVGSNGTGKSHLCTALAGALIKRGFDTRYVLWRDFVVEAKATVNDVEAYAALVEPLKRVDVLYIDDLFFTGKGQKPTVADVNLAYEILNHRYNNGMKMTIISSQFNFEQLLDIDEALGSRIYEKSKGFRLDFTGKPNWRLRE